MAGSITRNDVAKSRTELDRMKRSLRGWLKYRSLNDRVARGEVVTKRPVNPVRDVESEKRLAAQLHALLSEVSPDVQLPDPGVPGSAVELAKIVLTDGKTAAAGQQAIAGLQPWVLPVVIASALLLGVTTAIKSSADVAMEKERYECIKSGACTDYGFWLKAGAALGIGWLLWKELGVGNAVRGYIKKKGG